MFPLDFSQAYTKEGFDLFDEMLNTIDKETTIYLLRAEIRQNIERKQVVSHKMFPLDFSFILKDF